jgi:hypothetical protein
MSSSRGEHKAALESVEIARRLLPDFYEVWRVSAQVRDSAGDVLGAMADFERAFDLSEGRSDRDPMLVFYAQFLAKQEHFASAVEVVQSAARRRGAPIELAATYGWMLTLAGTAKEGAAVFEDLHEELFLLSGSGRSAYLTQYAESLRRAAETEARRGLHNEALQYVLRGIAVVAEACRQGCGDAYLVRQAQKCVREALFILSRRCERQDWEQFAALGLELAKDFDLIGDDQRALETFVDRWPLFANTQDFALLFPAFSRDSSPDQVPVVEGSLRPILFGRDYGFVAGDDGIEYWVHRGQVLSTLTWEQIRGLPTPRVRFVPAPATEAGRNPRALRMSVVSVDEHESLTRQTV